MGDEYEADLLHSIMAQLVEQNGPEMVLRAFTDTAPARRWLIDTAQLHFPFEDDFGSDESFRVRKTWEIVCVPDIVTVVHSKHNRPIG